ncbi:MAG: VCBS repeat-containing protein, partial [Deltaproteobacteria bacterium]|nr:VCBS repeat-containing protein [Deltaproteobacteria bacterium]
MIDVEVTGADVEAAPDEEGLLLVGHGGGQVGVAGLRAWDDLGEPLDAWMEAMPGGLRVHVDDDGASWPIHVDPVLSSYSWYALGTTSSSYLGWSVAGAGDVNGDGYDDVIVGAPYYSSYTGRAYVYHGSSSGLSYTASTTITGGSTSYYLGYAVDGAGDVNGDGYDDIIVGAYYYGSGYGAAYIHHGSSSGISSSASRTITGSSGYRLGQSVAGAGDVNGDGYDDVIIGAPGYSTYTGRAYVHHGSSSGIASSSTTTLTGSSTYYYLGYDVDGAGNVNGDRYADVIVGAYGYSSYTGRAYVHHGSSSGVSSSASTNLYGSTSSEYFGIAVAGAGDLNGDGYDDVAVGAPFYSSYSGRLAVYRGTSSGVSSSASTNLYGYSSSYFGYALDGAGDTDADGYDDLAVGAYYYSSGYGLLEVYQGSSSGLASSPESSITGFSTSHYLGRSVGGAGDVNGDGYADVIAGGYYYSSGYGLATAYLGYEDEDGDGYVLGGDGSYPDCDDSDASIYPYATETTGDGVDSDCDDYETCYYDADNDGYLASSSGTVTSTDTDCNDSYEGSSSDPFTDCDDASAADNPAASETVGNGDDDNCDGAETCYDDDDNDGYLDTTGDTRSSSDTDCSDAYEGLSTDPTTDCDDSDSGDNPGASETVGNGDDENCDGAETCYDDDDNDGYLDTTGDTRSSSDTDCADAYEGLSTDSTTDCDDSSASDYPGATETVGNADDENCDGAETCYDDDDNDGYLDTSGDTRASTDTDCSDAGEGTSSDPTTDCDDGDANDYPGATETTGNGDDENCDGAETCYTDADSDSYAVSTTLASADTDCTDSGEGTATEYAAGPDCDDANSSIRPGATETTGDEIDYNCDGAETCYTDADGDGYATASTRSSTDTDCADSGEATAAAYALGADCDDASAGENPGETEVCDASNTDEDCSGNADDSDSGTDASTKSTWYRDADSDSYGTSSTTLTRCDQPTGYVSNGNDCDDASAAISPADAEVTGSGGDENCDGYAACYSDADGDGYATSTVVYSSDSDCSDAGEASATVYTRGADCDDTDAGASPGGSEVCDAADTDEDCDGRADDDDSSASAASKTTYYADDDGDGYGDESGGVASCDAPAGWVATGGDCDDADAGVNP